MPDLNKVEWFDSMELVCRMMDMKVECVLAFCHKGLTFKVHQQKDAEYIKHVLIKVFETDSFVVYD